MLCRIIASYNSGGQNTGPCQYLLRIVEKQGLGPRGFGAVDMMHSGSRWRARTPEKKSKKVELYKVFDKPEYQDLEIQYEYDFGDCWEHENVLSGRAEHTDHFTCKAGQGCTCAEDAGNAPV